MTTQDRSLRGQVVWVTGASGFIGAHLVPRLLAQGAQVVAVDRAPRAWPHGVRSLTCDITDANALRHALAGLGRVDFGVHLAARVGDWGSWEDFEAVNVRGTRNILQAWVDAGARQIVHVSSIAVMGFEPGFLADELVEPQRTGDAYCDTKGEGEQVARSLQGQGAPVVILRPGDVYGPGSVPWVQRPLRMLAARQLPLVDGGGGHFGHVYIDNLLDGLMTALVRPAAAGRTYLLTDEEQHTSFGDYFRILAAETGLPEPWLSLPRPVALGLGWALEVAGERLGFAPPITRSAIRFLTRRGSYSIARARHELGYAPRIGLEEGVARVGAWYAEHEKKD